MNESDQRFPGESFIHLYNKSSLPCSFAALYIPYICGADDPAARMQ